MIKTDQLSYGIGNQPILENVDLHIEKNDFWLIFGPNGAGKTTLLRIMAGFLSGYHGAVRLKGKSILNYSRRELARIVTYLAQEEKLVLPLRVREVLLSGRYPYRSPWSGYSRKDRDIFRQAVDLFNLDRFLDRDIHTLSGGERKKVFIAAALIQDVSVILLDEPLNFLDPGSSRSIVSLLVNLHEQGRTVVVVSHCLERFFPVANKILAIKEGNPLYCGPRIFDPKLLKETYQVDYHRLRRGAKEIIYADG